jgi:acetate kinase
MFCYRIRKYVGAYLAALEGADGIVFTGGIGENAPEIRRRVCEPLRWAGVRLDAARNASGDVRITADDATLPVYVIPTDEEGLIARETMAILQPATPGG